MSRAVSTHVRTALLAALLLIILAGVCGGFEGDLAGDCPDCVIVALDLDPIAPGYQTNIIVEPGVQTISGVTIWIYDPTKSANLYSVGYVGDLLNTGILKVFQ